MGMYTEIIFGAELKEDTPNEVIETIYDLITCDNIDEFKYVPEHDFFRLYECFLLKHPGTCFYSTFNKSDKPKIFYINDITNRYILQFKAFIRNYNNQIELFLDWIKPFISFGIDYQKFYAIVCYEEQKEPTIYYLN